MRERDDSQFCEWTLDTEHPAAAVLWLPCNKGKSAQLGRDVLLCIVCEEKSSWLFPYACELAGNVVNADSFMEVEDEAELQPVLVARAATAQWPCGLFTVVTAMGGLHSGLRALGVGSNAKARKRAARIALAATVRVQSDTGTMDLADLSGDVKFLAFVRRARKLCGGLAGLAAEVGEGGTDAVPAPPPPPPYPFPQRQMLQPPPPPPRIPPSHQPQSQTSESLTHRVVEAVAPYEAERRGYLSLRAGDRVCLKWHKCEAPSPSDLFSSYVFGVRIDGPGHHNRFDAAAPEGWVPFDLVKFC